MAEKSSKPSDTEVEGQRGIVPRFEIGDNYIVQRSDDMWLPAAIVRFRFLDARQEYEYYVHYNGMNRRHDEWVLRDRIKREQLPPGVISGGIMTRIQKRRYDEMNKIHDKYAGMDPLTAALEKDYDERMKVKYIDCVRFGHYEIDTWFFSPYPDEYGRQKKLWICEYCLKYMRYEQSFHAHMSECPLTQPVGNEIYRKGTISIYEVDGQQYKMYCQNLCLFVKLFIYHKTSLCAVDDFLFYLLCEVDRHGAHIVGYFSKDKDSNNNLSCIVTLPPHQRKGYGNLLIAFSYELSQRERKVAGPERPLSDMGARCYQRYWSWALLEILRKRRHGDSLEIADLSRLSKIPQADVLSTLKIMKLVRYWKNGFIVSVTPKSLKECMNSSFYKAPKICLDRTALRRGPPHR